MPSPALMLLGLPGVAQEIDKRLPGPLSGLATLAAHPLSTLYNATIGRRTGPIQDVAGPVFNLLMSQPPERTTGDFVRSDRALEQPYTFIEPTYSPAERFQQQEFERMNTLPSDLRQAELNDYMTGAKTWPSSHEVMQMEQRAQEVFGPGRAGGMRTPDEDYTMQLYAFGGLVAPPLYLRS